MSNRKTDSEYSARHREKRKATRLPIDFYLDDAREKRLYEFLASQPNRKQFILDLLEKNTITQG